MLPRRATIINMKEVLCHLAHKETHGDEIRLSS